MVILLLLMIKFRSFKIKINWFINRLVLSKMFINLFIVNFNQVVLLLKWEIFKIMIISFLIYVIVKSFLIILIILQITKTSIYSLKWTKNFQLFQSNKNHYGFLSVILENFLKKRINKIKVFWEIQIVFHYQLHLKDSLKSVKLMFHLS